MNVFLGAMRLDGNAVTRRELFAYLARLPKQRDWESCGQGAFTAVAFARRHAVRPLIARHRGFVGAGDVRLDNRAEMMRLAQLEPDASDLEIVLAALDRRGPDVIAELLGDFAFIVWDAAAQKIIAARDAFGVKPLFYRRTRDLLLLSSRLEPLCGDERLDPDYVADFLIGMPGPSPQTIWQGALKLEPGAMLVQRGSVTAQSRYWSAQSFEPRQSVDEAEATEQFRHLFFDAVRKRVAAGETWAQLSGGLDSSAVVSTAQWLSRRQPSNALSGTVTIVDSLGNGDERRYSDLVIHQYAVPNESVADYGPWQRGYAPVPQPTDEPSPLFPFHARDHRLVQVVTQAGGKVLLSGLGSDHYMYGTLAYMADLFAKGSVRAGAGEILGWALQTRRSFWHTARASVLDPLRHNLDRHHSLEVPRWMNRDFARRTMLLDRLADVRAPRARAGRLYSTHTATELMRVANWVLRGPFEDRIEMRYPFLSRTLVEFTLRLPVSMKIRPQGRKWILREAMRGILPEPIRTRRGKGGMDARVLWSLQHERKLVDALLTDSFLADAGYIDGIELQKTVDMARRGEFRNTVHVLSVLALESWLRARSGMWPLEQPASSAA